MKLGEKIYGLRKSKGMSQEELASQLTVSRQAVSKWELNDSVPDTENIIQLSLLFGVSADYLLNDDYQSDEDIPAVRISGERLKTRYKNTFKIILCCVAGLFILGFIFWLVWFAVPARKITSSVADSISEASGDFAERFIEEYGWTGQ